MLNLKKPHLFGGTLEFSSHVKPLFGSDQQGRSPNELFLRSKTCIQSKSAITKGVHVSYGLGTLEKKPQFFASPKVNV